VEVHVALIFQTSDFLMIGQAAAVHQQRTCADSRETDVCHRTKLSGGGWEGLCDDEVVVPSRNLCTQSRHTVADDQHWFVTHSCYRRVDIPPPGRYVRTCCGTA
jgi:hypothetical protein